MATSTHIFQAPKGTRDFFPDDMAVRRHVESIWRRVSVNHGFDEIDGPTFEHLELYTVKSGPGIVSELFSFRREGGDIDYALRPEFTPTIARMYAAAAASLPKPTRWYCMPNHFRAERPQRGRLREFVQWNVDVIGDASPRADADVIGVALAAMEAFGLTAQDVRMKISHREVARRILLHVGVDEPRLAEAFDLIDKRDKIEADAFTARWRELTGSGATLADFDRLTACRSVEELERAAGDVGLAHDATDEVAAVMAELAHRGLADSCAVDLGIVRGLAYYTGTVFELHETTGRERAMAGGGRYDGLVELFGGPPTPAVGFAMGDVVMRLVLERHGLLEEPAAYRPRPGVFLVNVREEGAEEFLRLLTELRRAELHVRHSAKSTRNVGKLLGEASKTRARCAVILGKELDDGRVVLKDLVSGDQETIAVEDLIAVLRERLSPPPDDGQGDGR